VRPAVRYINEGRALLGAFATGASMFLLVYFLLIAGPSTRTGPFAQQRVLRVPAAVKATVHKPGFTHISMGGGLACGQAEHTGSNSRVVVTKTRNGSMCAQGGSMYGQLVAMHSPRRAIILMLLQHGPTTINGVAQPEYQLLRQLGAPQKLARQLTALIGNHPSTARLGRILLLLSQSPIPVNGVIPSAYQQLRRMGASKKLAAQLTALVGNHPGP